LNPPRGLFPFSVSSYLKNNAPRKNLTLVGMKAERVKRKECEVLQTEPNQLLFRVKVSERIYMLVQIHFFILIFIAADAVFAWALLPCSSGYKPQTHLQRTGNHFFNCVPTYMNFHRSA
jgi:hypothetical protein